MLRKPGGFLLVSILLRKVKVSFVNPLLTGGSATPTKQGQPMAPSVVISPSGPVRA
jgi:hypothetical protein